MPRFDLAGNPLPDTPAPPSRAAVPPANVDPPPHVDIPPRQDAQGHPIHTAPAPRLASPGGYDLAGNPLTPSAAPLVSNMGSPSASAGAVRYDLAGNPIAPAPTAAPSYAAPPVYSQAAPSGTWPPPPAGMAQGYQPYQQYFHNSSGEQGDVPPEIARLRWNWGAFFFPIFWSKKHGMTTLAAILGGSLVALRFARNFAVLVNPLVYFFLLVVYGVTYLSIAVYFGATGHRHGWRNRRFNDVQDYLSCQTKWMWWGIGINAVTSVILPLLIFAGLFSLGMSAASRAPYSTAGPSGPSSPYGSGGGFGTGPGSAAPSDGSGGGQ